MTHDIDPAANTVSGPVSGTSASAPHPASSDTLKAEIERLASTPSEQQPIEPEAAPRKPFGSSLPLLPPAFKPYQPLLALLGVALAGSAAVSVLSAVSWMTLFMGFWLVLFALVKLFDVAGFADKFARYDLISERFPPYAMAYPFIELALGLALLAGFFVKTILFCVLVLACVTLTGVVLQLVRKQKFECACMGALLAVPLSTVTVVENGLMILMSVAGLAR